MTTIDFKARDSQVSDREAAREAAAAPDFVIKVDLDERAFAFPQAKQVSQLQILAYRPHAVRLEATFAYNQAKASHALFEMSAEDARDLVRKLVETVYRAQSSQVVSRSTTLSISVVTNGYLLQFGDHEGVQELFLSTGCIWRVCNGLARAVDFIAPIASN
jgi:hypothetical protein